MEITERNLTNHDALLDIKGYFPRGAVNKIAICERCIFRRDINKNPYLQYTFRDVNGCRITGRQFDLEDISNIGTSIRNAQNAIVRITGKISYFGQRYIAVEHCEVTSTELTTTVKNKFFVHNIPNYDSELAIMQKSMDAILSPDIKELFTVLSITTLLENSFNTEVMDGLKGSSISLINTFNNSLAQIIGKQGKLLMAANMILEAINTKAQQDSAKVLSEFTTVQNVIGENMSVERRKLLEILKSTIYLTYKFEQDIYNSDAFIINSVRDFCYTVAKQKEFFNSNDGVFLYEGYTVSRGEV